MKSLICKQDINYLSKLPHWESLKGETVLITGATGMLGAYISLAALEACKKKNLDLEVLLMCRNKDKAEALFGKNQNFLFQDVREELPSHVRPSYILHIAGPVGPNEFRDHPVDVLSVNTEGSLNLLQRASACGCKGFVFASTHEVYGKVDGLVNEFSQLGAMDSMDSRSCYGMGKRCGESALACYNSQYGLRTMSARLSRMYGPLMNLDSGLFVCDFIKSYLNNEPVNIAGDGNLMRPLCYIRDAAEALLYILVKGEGGSAYNVQSEELTAICDIADMIAAEGDMDVYMARPETRELIRMGHHLDCTRLKALGWQQRVGINQGICRTLEHFGGLSVEG